MPGSRGYDCRSRATGWWRRADKGIEGVTDQLHSLIGVRLFTGLDEASRRALEQRCRWRRFAPHQQIIEGQADSRDVFFIVAGKVRVVNYAASGREVSLEDIGAGGCFGELAAIDGQPRSATVLAMEPTIVATVGPADFLRFVTERPPLAQALLRHLTAMIRKSTERIFDLSTLGAHERVYAELLRLGLACLAEDNTAAIHPIPVHSDIANRIGTTRETVARVFGELARNGLVRRDRDTLTILDFGRLTEMVGEWRGE